MKRLPLILGLIVGTSIAPASNSHDQELELIRAARQIAESERREREAALERYESKYAKKETTDWVEAFIVLAPIVFVVCIAIFRSEKHKPNGASVTYGRLPKLNEEFWKEKIDKRILHSCPKCANKFYRENKQTELRKCGNCNSWVRFIFK